MTEFTTSATVDVEVSPSSLRSARNQIESELGNATMSPSAVTDGGRSGLGRTNQHLDENLDLNRTRNDLLRDLIDTTEKDAQTSRGGLRGAGLAAGGLGLAAGAAALGSMVLGSVVESVTSAIPDLSPDDVVGTVAVRVGDLISDAAEVTPSDVIESVVELAPTDIIAEAVTLEPGDIVSGTVDAQDILDRVTEPSESPSGDPSGGGDTPGWLDILGIGTAGGAGALAGKTILDTIRGGAGGVTRGAGGAASVATDPQTMRDIANAPDILSAASRGESPGHEALDRFTNAVGLPSFRQWPGYVGPTQGDGDSGDGGGPSLPNFPTVGQSEGWGADKSTVTDSGQYPSPEDFGVNVDYSPSYEVDASDLDELRRKQEQDLQEIERRIDNVRNQFTRG